MSRFSALHLGNLFTFDARDPGNFSSFAVIDAGNLSSFGIKWRDELNYCVVMDHLFSEPNRP